MSRIAKKAKKVPAGVEVKVENGLLSAKGPKGNYSFKLPSEISLDTEGEGLVRINLGSLAKDERTEKRLLGLYTRLLENAMVGVEKGYEKVLQMEGIGFKANVQGAKINLALGFSHDVNVDIPEGLDVSVQKNEISVKGVDKQLVGQFAATVRAKKKPEPYKGKGIRYKGEYIRRKAGKAAGK